METSTGSFKDLFESGPFHNMDKFCDVTIVSIDEMEFKAHKLFLSKGSEYFHTLYKTSIRKEKDSSILEFDGEVVEAVLVFLYTGDISLNDFNIAGIISVADYLLVDELLSRCKIFALHQISIQNCVPLLIASNLVNRLGITEHCHRYVLVHFRSLINDKSSDIADLPLGILKQLLSDDSLGVVHEKSVWNTIVIWVEGNKNERLKYVPELLSCIRRCSENYWLASGIATHPIYKEGSCESIDLDNMAEKPESGLVYSLPSRWPKKMYIVMCRTTFPYQSPTLQFYLTYDQHLDIWCKIAENHGNFHTLISVDRFVYMFNTITNSMAAFDVIEKVWVEKDNSRCQCPSYVAQSQNKIFAVGGGLDFLANTPITEARRYEPTTDTWSYCAPIPAVNVCGVSAINEKLYVIGYHENPDQLQMAALTYDTDADAWLDISAPKRFRTNFAITTFQGKLYIFGGTDEDNNSTTSVEEYTSESDRWDSFPDLPLRYDLPRAITLEDKLVVYESCPGDGIVPRLPHCIWNGESREWELDSVFSPYNEVHRYEFCSINDQSVLRDITKKRRDPWATWTKSPFAAN